MTDPAAKADQNEPLAKSRFNESLAEPLPSDNVRLTCSESEQTSEPLRAGDLQQMSPAPRQSAVASPDGETLPDDAGKASLHQPTDQVAKQATERPLAENYKEELVTHSLKALVADLLKSGRREEAEIGSRVLVDLSERKITTSEAKEILELLKAHEAGNAAQRYADFGRENKIFKMRVVMSSVALALMFVFIGIYIVASNLNFPSTPPAVVSNQLPSRYQFLPVSAEKGLHSIRGAERATFTITNRLNKTVSVYWLNYQGARVLYGRLAPGESLGQQSFITHPWVVVDDRGRSIMLFLPGTEPNMQIDVR